MISGFDVCRICCLDAPEPGRMGIASPGKTRKIGITTGQELQDICVVMPPGEFPELFSLCHRTIGVEQYVGAQGHRDIVLASQFDDRACRAFSDLLARAVPVRDRCRIGDGGPCCDQSLDEFAFDQYVLAFDKLAVRSVKNTHVPEQQQLRRTLGESWIDGIESGNRKARRYSLQD